MQAVKQKVDAGTTMAHGKIKTQTFRYNYRKSDIHDKLKNTGESELEYTYVQ